MKYLMWFEMPNEDEYWERRREEWENPKLPPDYEPEPEKDWIFIDEEVDDIEAENGCPMEELGEGDLFEIIDSMRDISGELISAKWDRSMWGIQYTYKGAA